MANVIVLSGELKKLTVNKPRDPKKNASAIVLLQYGVSRETTNNAVEFVNATLIRIPSYKFPSLEDKLREGQTITVVGHVQGVWKNGMDQGYLTTELVADRIEIEAQPEVTPAAAEEHDAA